MSNQRFRMPQKVSTGTLVSAIAIFIGILLLAWGYYAGIMLIIYAGLAVTLAGASTEASFLLMGQQVIGIPRHKRI